ncbi:hypothetical protein P7K49_031216 [Saguinus oedipus]|uniref:Uncharacterized protein n=1 Tax=Saguinus oedipus TaxID=9490 RepID=A0ABQ9U4E7_SAGOE|nr:hypothetical protein P7K49_031216 [Saguinus oedipus]
MDQPSPPGVELELSALEPQPDEHTPLNGAVRLDDAALPAELCGGGTRAWHPRVSGFQPGGASPAPSEGGARSSAPDGPSRRDTFGPEQSRPSPRGPPSPGHSGPQW